VTAERGFVEAPSGTVTIMFTDIEGSTRLWEGAPDSMRAALARHDAIVRDAIKAHGGFVFATGGDGFAAAFARAGDGLAAAADAQNALHAQAWPAGSELRVRMGLHAGVCDERDGDYFGPTVNRTARLAAIAHGGQIVVSGSVAATSLEPSLPGGVRLRDMGEHRLKDLGRPEHVFQVDIEGLDVDFPPLRSLTDPLLRQPAPAGLGVHRPTPGNGRGARLTTQWPAGAPYRCRGLRQDATRPPGCERRTPG
jgi:class 3 adenylate cyclase